MRFALVDDKQVEAEYGLKGLCPGCFQPVLAKCGTQRLHHWAHRNNKACDSWWEAETEWHRSWKNYFPVEWQEIFLPDEATGEKHIADVLTDYGFVVEFQHSTIDPNERNIRENFYRNMVWVVDGMRLKYDFKRFLKRRKHFQSIKPNVYRIDNPEESFPTAWLGSSVPVIFHFTINESKDDIEVISHYLFCLFPIRIGRRVTFAEIPYQTFINTIVNGDWLPRASNFIDDLTREKQEWDYQDALRRHILALESRVIARLQRPMRYVKRRQF